MKKGFLNSLVNFMFDAKVALAELTLEDGTLIRVEDETMMAYRVMEDGSEELLAEGEYTLMDGSKLVIDSEGKVVPQISQETPSETVVDEEMKEHDDEEMKEHDDKDMKKMEEQFSALKNEKIELAAQLAKLTEELKETNQKYNELLKTSVEKFKSIEKSIVEKPLTRLEGIKANLKAKINK
jgi:hypothetical protein